MGKMLHSKFSLQLFTLLGFWGSFLLGITMYVIAFVLFFVFGRTMPVMAVIMGFVMYVAFISVSLGAAAHIYGTLSKELDAA